MPTIFVFDISHHVVPYRRHEMITTSFTSFPTRTFFMNIIFVFKNAFCSKGQLDWFCK